MHKVTEGLGVLSGEGRLGLVLNRRGESKVHVVKDGVQAVAIEDVLLHDVVVFLEVVEVGMVEVRWRKLCQECLLRVEQ